jgi:hypothetical protein
MTGVIMDPRGRLVQFNAVPPQLDTRKEPAPRIDWAPLFAEAGLDPEKYTSTEAQWSPPSYADARAAWEGKYADHPDIPIHIEAAAYRGRPVYFRVLAPWDKPLRQEESETSTRDRAGVMILTTVLLMVLAGAVLIARRNLRLGRGDRQGALKLALFVFAVTLFGMLVGGLITCPCLGANSPFFTSPSALPCSLRL